VPVLNDEAERAGIDLTDHARLPVGIELLVQREAADTGELGSHCCQARIVAGAMIAFYAHQLRAEPRDRLNLAEPLVDDLQLLG